MRQPYHDQRRKFALKAIRIGQSCSELKRLTDALKSWQRLRKDRDKYSNGGYRGQYQSQVDAIADEVRRAAAVIEAMLLELSEHAEETPLATVYQECGRHDRRTIWLWRAWNYFREKFDQRDDPDVAPALRAADEVLWSCYKPFFNGSRVAMPPAPLPYIEETYSPTAMRPDQASHVEKEEAIDEGPLKSFFASLPVPLLQLPPTIVTSPWAHVLIAHETGHFIQDLVPAIGGYRTVFREKVERAAKSVRDNAEDARLWGKWAPEIFADLYSVLMMGPWAVWVMAQFELARPGKLTTRGTSYPSPLARIYLLARFAAQAGFPADPAVLASLGIDADKEAAGSVDAEADLKIAGKVAELINLPLSDNLGLLSDVIGVSARPYEGARALNQAGEVHQWCDALLGGPEKNDEQHLDAARFVAAGTAKACKEIMEMQPGQDRDRAISNLAASAFKHMAACAEPGTRAAPPSRKPAGSLAAILSSMSDDELFQ